MSDGGSESRFRRVMRVFTTLANGEVTKSVIVESSLLHALIETASGRYGESWETVARKFREKHGTPVGAGYNKEIE